MKKFLDLSGQHPQSKTMAVICHYVTGSFIFKGKHFRAGITVFMTASSLTFVTRNFCKLKNGTVLGKWLINCLIVITVFVCLGFVCLLGFLVPLENISLIWIRRHCR